MIRTRKRLATKKVLVATVGVAALSFAIACDKNDPPQAPVGNLMRPQDWAMPDVSAPESPDAGGADARLGDATITTSTGAADAGFAAARDAGVVPVKRGKPDFRTSSGNLMAPDDVRSPTPPPTTPARVSPPPLAPKSGGR